MVEKPPQSVLDRTYTREDFGPGEAGESAWRAMKSATQCGFRLEKCEFPPTHTLDFDVIGEVEHIPLCEPHDEPVKKEIEELYKEQGRFTLFGRNGFGRD